MSKTMEISLYPATGWTVSTVQGHALIVLQLDFIGPGAKDKSTPEQTPRFVLSPEDALALAEKLREAAFSTGEIERRKFPRTVQ